MTDSSTARSVVLESTRPPDGSTRYIDQVVTFADPRFDFRYLSPRNVLRRVDVFHVHWPEVIVRGRNSVETAMRSLVFRLALRLMQLRRTGIVRTMHNPAPHEAGGPWEARALRALDEATDVFVVINPSTGTPEGKGRAYIPHGHYRDRFAGYPHRPPAPGRFVYAGLIRPYKGVEQLLAAFRDVTIEGATLRVAGSPTPRMRTVVEDFADRDGRVTARFGFLPDPDFVAEVTEAELVCLPYRELHNSGILLVALSLNRPVLVPDTPTTRIVSEEVGPGWVHLFEGELQSHHLERALDDVRASVGRSAPELRDRDWDVVAQRYGAVFDQAIALHRRPS